VFRALFALTRAGFLTAASYRLAFAFSLGGALLTLAPLFYVTNALQPVMADKLRTEGSDYFAFTVIGTMMATVLPTTVQALAARVGAGIGNGTLETMLGTPASRWAVLAGLIGYDLGWTLVRALVMLAAGVLLGVRVAPGGILPGLGVIALILVAYLGIGAGIAAMMVAFRTTGPVPVAVTGVSTLLGGTYFPTSVIPSWVEHVSVVIPLTYGLRALRGLWLGAVPFTAVASDVAVLAVLCAALLAIGLRLLALALERARRDGSLGQY
jgi:ABC-2 type transport system permease protein